jgi:hypothetical protein
MFLHSCDDTLLCQACILTGSDLLGTSVVQVHYQTGGIATGLSKRCSLKKKKKKNKTPRLESATELYRPRDFRLLAKLVPTSADRGCHVVTVTNLYGRILAFLDQSRYFFFQVAPQLYSRD